MKDWQFSFLMCNMYVAVYANMYVSMVCCLIWLIVGFCEFVGDKND